ncbi:MAG: deoxyribonuclease IV [Candidatus Thermoplasmatota archaeon]|nr:deoxyribonuclease IV [Candidatus Thermoplasmatota archaeon]
MMLGGHVSISGGLDKAPERARQATCDCMQIFSKNQMQWKAKPLDLEEAERFKENSKRFSIKETVIHDSYLINLGSPDKRLLRQSREAFLDEMARAKHLGVRNLIFHPGAHMGAGEQAGLKKIAESLNWARTEFGSGDVAFVIEITAGQGTVLGHSFEQIEKIITLLNDQKNVGVCFDTAHAYAAGYDVKTRKGYERTFQTFEDVIGLEHMKAMHINDSKVKQGSRIDRHEQIGKGFIGLDGFRNFMNDKRWESIPLVLETPQGEKGYRSELKTLRALRRK